MKRGPGRGLGRVRKGPWLRVGGGLAAAALTFALAGCATVTPTRVRGDHPLVVAPDAPGAVRVYFLRPEPERAMGYADNALRVALEGRPLLTLNKGEYTLAYLHPRRNLTLTLSNLAARGPGWEPVPMERRFRLDLEPGRAYAVLLTPVNAEFRGVYFQARVLAPERAAAQVQGLRAVGAAREAPLHAFVGGPSSGGHP